MMVDVDYLSRMHNWLIQAHATVVNTFAKVDRVARPCVYKVDTWDTLLAKGRYSFKPSRQTVSKVSVQTSATAPAPKKAIISDTNEVIPRSVSPVQILMMQIPRTTVCKWKLDPIYDIIHSAYLQRYHWLLINRHYILPVIMGQHYISQYLVHYNIEDHSPEARTTDLHCIMMIQTHQLKLMSIDYFILSTNQHCMDGGKTTLAEDSLHAHAAILQMLVQVFHPKALIVIVVMNAIPCG